jgi:hypothetical protein
MRTLGTLLLLGVVVVVVLGFYFQWWSFSTTSGPDHTRFDVDVNKEKIREDLDRAKEKVSHPKGEPAGNRNEPVPASPQP